ncbi:hypothetical protein R51_26700 [Bacillus safensis]|nr:hypothetical protein B33_02910 [Bacillus safensis]GLF87625.1 hypothetical protein R51_26700 [Bacillus safensis]GLJ03590.1 hypothetical protein OAS1_28390 [Bacillus sp. YKCMOAS1]GMG79495.1 hypothetical protein ShirakiTA10_24570 [Bacillus safensis]
MIKEDALHKYQRTFADFASFSPIRSEKTTFPHITSVFLCCLLCYNSGRHIDDKTPKRETKRLGVR